MDQPGPSQPPPRPSTTENPVVAVGRKVKEALTSKQQPSVRILRGSPSTGRRYRATESEDFAEKPAPQQYGYGQTYPPEPRPELSEHYAAHPAAQPAQNENTSSGFANARNRAGAAIRSMFGRKEPVTHNESSDDEYDTETVDLLDVMDPEVATLSTLTNVQNSLFVPSLGRFLDRRPAYRLTDRPGEARSIDKLRASLKKISAAVKDDDGKEEHPRPERPVWRPQLTRNDTIPTTLTDSRYAVLPDGVSLDGWTHEQKEELDDLVRHKLHSRKERFKRSMKGFGQYVRRPLGLFITVYATLITLFGAAWVLFLIGWISLGSKRDYVINVVDNILVALFAIIGDGLAPFRAVDTYHMAYIAHYHRKTWKKRRKLGLPALVDHNDLPDQRQEEARPFEVDLESLVAKRMPRFLARRIAPRLPNGIARRLKSRTPTDDPSTEYTVLTEKEQATLEYHERKFSKSHTFYKPHETETHYAFPLKLLVAVVVLLDLHSALQITLGACTWGIPYKTRPFALTTVVLCCSITCNITGGLLITVGDRRTRKKDVIERMMRQELTEEAIEEMESRWLKEAEEKGHIDKSVRKQIEDHRDEAENQEVKKAWKNVPLLPKTLLGKGVDHRQPSLPQKSRRSGSNATPPSSGASTPKRSRFGSSSALPRVQERPPPLPSRPQPAATAQEAPTEGKAQKIMRAIRRADLDRS